MRSWLHLLEAWSEASVADRQMLPASIQSLLQEHDTGDSTELSALCDLTRKKLETLAFQLLAEKSDYANALREAARTMSSLEPRDLWTAFFTVCGARPGPVQAAFEAEQCCRQVLVIRVCLAAGRPLDWDSFKARITDSASSLAQPEFVASQLANLANSYNRVVCAGKQHLEFNMRIKLLKQCSSVVAVKSMKQKQRGKVLKIEDDGSMRVHFREPDCIWCIPVRFKDCLFSCSDDGVEQETKQGCMVEVMQDFTMDFSTVRRIPEGAEGRFKACIDEHKVLVKFEAEPDLLCVERESLMSYEFEHGMGRLFGTEDPERWLPLKRLFERCYCESPYTSKQRNSGPRPGEKKNIQNKKEEMRSPNLSSSPMRVVYHDKERDAADTPQLQASKVEQPSANKECHNWPEPAKVRLNR